MLRRKFLGIMTALGASGLASVAAVDLRRNGPAKPETDLPSTHRSAETVTYLIQGFTCITCAVGLEALLRQKTGVLSATASYMAANAVIQFDSKVLTEASLKGFILDMGFTIRSSA